MLESGLAEAAEDLEIATVDCGGGRDGPRARVRADFGTEAARGSLTRRVTAAVDGAPRRCRLDADGVQVAVRGLAWAPDADRRVLVVTRDRASVPAGRRAFEEVVGDALHHGIALYGLVWAPNDAEDTLDRVLGAARAFARAPTRTHPPSGRDLFTGALVTGGRWHAAVELRPSAPPATTGLEDLPDATLERLRAGPCERFARAAAAELERRARRRPELALADLRRELELDALYGPMGSDQTEALARLAKGALRPSEVARDQVPAFLRGAALEPLLDELWAFVAARAPTEQLVAAIAAGRAAEVEVGPPLAGAALAQDILRVPRPPPSRR